MTTRRKFVATSAATLAAFAAPAIAPTKILRRMQTYAGPALAKHVIVPAVDMFNKIARDRMQIQLFFADQRAFPSDATRYDRRGAIRRRLNGFSFVNFS